MTSPSDFEIPAIDAHLEEEVRRRRTFAIISHPDAGKTTLTEKFLLYGGAVDEAGSVRARRNARRSTSDWMALERERGISITSTVLQFDAFGCRFNLLDTPGHQDFSEDTYRTLMAADSAVMVIDSAKGIEAQTRKLFDVCRARRIPILTFINKLDHPGREPLELLDEIESTLQIGIVPMNWPIGDGPSFQGVYDLQHKSVLRFARTEGGRLPAPVTVGNLDDPILGQLIGDTGHESLREQVRLIEAVTPKFERSAFLAGDLTPVFFGSALNNFGVEPFLAAIKELAPSPGPRKTSTGLMSPYEPAFSGFVFKIQANMDPLHRDRMAFLRICSGRFEKDMAVHHHRLGRKVKLSRPHRLFARERETVEEAFAGDVVGLINPGIFLIGDSLSAGAPVEFEPIPRFEPEVFAIIEASSLGKLKQFARGLEQLKEEGAVRVFNQIDAGRNLPIVAAVGSLQFDVVLARLKDEYGVDATARPLVATVARKVPRSAARQELNWPRQAVLARDDDGDLICLFPSQWELDLFQRNNAGVQLEPII